MRTNPTDAETPESMLDRLRSSDEWDDRERDEFLGRLVEQFPPERVARAVLPRLEDLGGPDAEALLRLVEANPSPELVDALARALVSQPELPPERAWEALSVLEGSGVIERHPSLVELRDDLREFLEADDPIDQLVEQIEGEPEGPSLALHGLGAVEADLRPEIVMNLAESPFGPGLVEFLRLLVYAPDIPTRAAALSVLGGAPLDAPGLSLAWQDLQVNHPDPSVRDVATRHAGRPAPSTSMATRSATAELRSGGRLVRSLVTAVDANGRASVVVAAEKGGRRATAAFVCDVLKGVVDVLGETTDDPAEADIAFDELAGRLDRESLTDRHELALGLLAGALLLGGPSTPPATRYWVEATVGRDVKTRPFLADFPEWSPAEPPDAEDRAEAKDVLEACPDWRDDSPLTRELAEEIRLRVGALPPDPVRDAGAYRFLFERRLGGELEKYRRMLLWTAWFWREDGRRELSRSALTLAWELSDAQNAVPGHPFTVALTTRSFARASEVGED